jgi:fibronectin type 3 domain-containing protein
VCPFWVSLVLLAVCILQPGCRGSAGKNGLDSTAAASPSPSVSHSVELTWNPSVSEPVESYHVYRGSQSGGPYALVGNTSKDKPNFTDTNVQPGRTYFYVVTAVNRRNTVNEKQIESTYSNEVRADIPHP